MEILGTEPNSPIQPVFRNNEVKYNIVYSGLEATEKICPV